jgi:hypothetical protein
VSPTPPRPVTIRLPTRDGGAMVLEARCPGTREFLRASVDYDNIPDAAGEADAFNLVVHRVRSPGSEHVEDQEIFTRASVHPKSPQHWCVAGRVLAGPPEGPVPLMRPQQTERGDLRSFAAYVASSPDGDGWCPTLGLRSDRLSRRTHRAVRLW